MKITVNWIKNLIDFDLPPVDELAEKIGAQLGAVEEVVNLGEKYQGIPVVKVVVCEPLENSDHLHRCLVDDGGFIKDVERNEDGLVQVLTGAPNIHADMLAVWLAPGTTVPDSVGKAPFVLESRNMRGSMSHGMLASAKELALGDGHEGLLEVDKNITPGTPFVEAYHLDDFVIDIENKMFTHRPDCFGALGVARELAGILGKEFHNPNWYVQNPELPRPEGEELRLEVQNDIPQLVPRFTAIAIKDVEVKPSPMWLQVALLKVGQKPINNIVDLTNFYMLVTGQPLHAYDYDKVASGKLGVRNANSGEKLALLNGKTIELNEADMVITDGEKPIGLGGVMGGTETEVSSETKNIILECATFDMYTIRRTSMRHGLFTDAVTRFNKGQSPLQNLAVSAKVVGDIVKLTGGKVASNLVDINNVAPDTLERGSLFSLVNVTTEFVNSRLGLKLSADEMAQLLKNVNFDVAQNSDELEVKAPFWRTDIEIKEDVVEEVGRLYGYDHLPMELPRRDITPAAKDELLALKTNIRARLAKAGANEVLTYSFVHGNLLEKVGQATEQAFQLDNALSPDLQYFRLSLTPSLLEKIHPNNKAGYDEFALFELGKTHNLAHANTDDGLPTEFEHLALVLVRSGKSVDKSAGAAFYDARKYLVNLASALGLQLSFAPIPADLDSPILKPFDPNRAALVTVEGTDISLGVVGEYRAAVRKSLKLPQHTAGFEFGLTQLRQAISGKTSHYVSLPRFPKVTQDITLKVDAHKPYAEVYNALDKAISENTIEQTQTRLEPLDIFQPEGEDQYKNLTFRFTVASYERTLTDAEVAKVLDRAAEELAQKLGANRV